LAVALMVPPLLLLLCDPRIRSRTFDDAMRRTFVKGGLIAGATLFAVALLALGVSWLTPDPHAAPTKIVLDQLAPEALGEHTAILVGMPRAGYAVSYEVLLKIGRYRHTFVPLTPSNWSPDQPVRFLVETTLYEVAGGGLHTTGKGLLLRHKVPGYLRDVLQRKGILLADDVMLHTTDSNAATGDWYVLAGLSGFGGILAFVLALALGRGGETGGAY
jgi:hypothetical protein